MSTHLTLTTGPAGSLKAEHAVTELLDGASGAGGLSFLVVPTEADRRYFIDAIAQRAPVALGVEVGMWSVLIHALAGSPPVMPSDATSEYVVVRDALLEQPEFTQALKFPGFVQTARYAVTRLRRAQIWGGSDLDRALATLPGLSRAVWQRLAERVGELSQARHLYDDAWFEQQAWQRISSGKVAVDRVVAYDVVEPSPWHQQVLLKLAEHIPVEVVLPWRPGRVATEPIARLRDEWRGKGAHVRELPVAIRPTLEPIAWLWSEIFEGTDPCDAPAVGDEPAIRFVDTCGPRMESDEVVRELVRAHARGVAWGDMAVLSAHAEKDADVLRAAMKLAGVPGDFRVRRMAVDMHAGSTVVSVLRSLQQGDPVGLLSALKSPLFSLSRSALDQAEITMRTQSQRPTMQSLLELATVRAAVPAQVIALHSALSEDGIADSASATAVIDTLRELIGSLRPRDEGDLRLLSAFIRVLDTAQRSTANPQSLGPASLTALLEQLPLQRRDSERDDQVVVASISDVSHQRFATVVLRSMHESGFGSRVDDDDDRPSTSRDIASIAVTRALDNLVVVRQAADANGSIIPPHAFWLELDRMFPDEVAGQWRRRHRGLEAIQHPLTGDLMQHEVTTSVARYLGDGVQVSGVPTDVSNHIEQLQVRLREPQLTGAALASIRDRQTWSATELETYAKCPAQWLLSRLLRIRDADDDKTRLTAGQYVHELARRVVPLFYDQADRESLDIAALVAKYGADALAAADPAQLLHPAEVQRQTAFVVDMLDTERTWPAPTQIQCEVDLAKAYAPLQLQGVNVVGRVDRVDVHADGAVLHDYKTGSQSPSPAKLADDAHWQLALYWLAIERSSHAAQPMAGVYRKVKEAGKMWGLRTTYLKDHGMLGSRSRPLKDEQARDILDEIEKRADQSIVQARSGNVDVAAVDRDGPCSYCSFGPICRVAEVQS